MAKKNFSNPKSAIELMVEKAAKNFLGSYGLDVEQLTTMFNEVGTKFPAYLNALLADIAAHKAAQVEMLESQRRTEEKMDLILAGLGIEYKPKLKLEVQNGGSGSGQGGSDSERRVG